MSMLFIATLFCLVMVSGAVLNPANSATISGTAVLNASNASLPDMVNCSFYALSASTANSSWSLLGTFTNESADPANINGTFDSSILEDSTDYQFNATCRNSSNDLTSSVGTATVTIDNTVPQAPTLSPADKTVVTSSGTQTFTGTVTDSNTTSCTYTIYRGGNTADGESGSGTYSTTSCTFTKSFSTTSDNGVWYWTMTASDGTNTSTSQNEIQVNLPGSGGGGLTGGSAGVIGDSDKQGILVVVLIVVVLAIILIVLLLKSKN